MDDRKILYFHIGILTEAAAQLIFFKELLCFVIHELQRTAAAQSGGRASWFRTMFRWLCDLDDSAIAIVLLHGRNAYFCFFAYDQAWYENDDTVNLNNGFTFSCISFRNHLIRFILLHVLSPIKKGECPFFSLFCRCFRCLHFIAADGDRTAVCCGCR